MNFGLYEIISGVVVIAVLLGIRFLSSPRTSVAGNRLGALAMLGSIIVVLLYRGILGSFEVLAGLVAGGLIGLLLAIRVTMLRMPQLVALLNGFGGLASLLVASVVVLEGGSRLTTANILSSQLAIIVGGITFGGSMVAAAKLDGKVRQKPLLLRGHSVMSLLLLLFMAALAAYGPFARAGGAHAIMTGAALASLAFGVLFAVRIGGADMPVTISLLNASSGLAASICGFALGDYLLIAIGAVVGAAGLILTRIMCRAMNRSLLDILTGRTAYADGIVQAPVPQAPEGERAAPESEESRIEKVLEIISVAQTVIVVPGYGMAVSQAQSRVKELYDILTSRGTEVRFAIHPVAGRMPGHMNVLLAEVDIPYEVLCELDDINPCFGETDLVIIVGACDVVNPAAISAEGTPIYGMPILHVHEAKHVVVFNLDTSPGYSCVENPLYEKSNVIMMLGNATDSLAALLERIR